MQRRQSRLRPGVSTNWGWTHSFYSGDLYRLLGLFNLGLVTVAIKVPDEALFVARVLETGLVHAPGLMSAGSTGGPTGASSRMNMEQYLHQYCFLETQYLYNQQCFSAGRRRAYSVMV